uniref:Helicase-associated domain-containing protein n=1 Tax=Ditylenchus dipsaci TaxID=166011 RepID=A0A915CRY8_9BILA
MWIAKSNAAQRKGRAGRCRNGYCFRLYTSEDYENMSETQIPEMERASLHDVVLHAKIFAPKKTSVKQFLAMALDPPSVEAIDYSIAYLKEIGALDEASTNDELSLTKLGGFLAFMPLDVQLSRMLFFGVMLKCLKPIIDLVAALAYKDPYVISLEEEQDLADLARDAFGHRDFSDHLMLIRALDAFAALCSTGPNPVNQSAFCKEKYLNPMAMRMMLGIRSQLMSEMKNFQLLPTSVDGFSAPEYNSFSQSWPMVQAAILGGCSIASSISGKPSRFDISKKDSAIVHPGCVVKRHMSDSKHYKKSIAHFANDERDPNVEFLAYQELVKLREGIVMKTVTVVPPLTAFIFGGKLSASEYLIQKIYVNPVSKDPGEPLAKDSQIDIGITDWLTFSDDFNLMQLLSKLRCKAALYLSQMLEDGKGHEEHEAFLKPSQSSLRFNPQGRDPDCDMRNFDEAFPDSLRIWLPSSEDPQKVVQLVIGSPQCT